ncbi:MAG: hypothetical protein CBC48_07450 [bacterium TMED88]|nr:hypothetical protein [Deltaproteobacteria bacterium]OUV32926.1 MAG: hypothetical protein CBC48_07450 [bacterium TMED88]
MAWLSGQALGSKRIGLLGLGMLFQGVGPRARINGRLKQMRLRARLKGTGCHAMAPFAVHLIALLPRAGSLGLHALVSTNCDRID